jgi:hypothetical protein
VLSVFGRRIKGMIRLRPEQVWTCSVTRSARPRPTSRLSPSSDGKQEAATAVVVAPDDGHEDARNMLTCI